MNSLWRSRRNPGTVTKESEQQDQQQELIKSINYLKGKLRAYRIKFGIRLIEGI